MANYEFTASLSPIDFELLSKDLLEAELSISLETFSEGRDKGIDLRYVALKRSGSTALSFAMFGNSPKPPELIVQCKRFANFANLKSKLKNDELPKIAKLKPHRYILTTSVSLSPQQADELKEILSPYVLSTGDIYGKERLNSLLTKHAEIERRHIKLWIGSAGVLESIVAAGTHVVSREEVERTILAAKIYVRNASFDEALAILKQHHVCIISGLPGIGKTTLARMLLLYFYEKKYDVVKIESDISEARAVGYHKRPRFYYYDDFLGQTAQADKLNKNEDQKLLDFMASIRDSRESVFVLTTREYILNQAKLHYEKLAREKFDHRICIIDLDKYSRRIRAQILYNHLHFSDLPRTHIQKLVAARGYFQIVDHANYNPRLIEFLTSLVWIGNIPPEKYLALFIRNLDNPVEIWGHAFRNQLSDRARHLLYVLTTLPRESRIADVEGAFTTFHQRQCVRFGIAQSAIDFKMALKELDGTFVATRRVQETVLVRFQNPSIRDFMQNLLLGGETLAEVIESLVFFEQAQWFLETLTDDEPQVPLGELKRHAGLVMVALKNLIEANNCLISIDGYQAWQRIVSHSPNFSSRLATVALGAVSFGAEGDSEWVKTRISELASKLEAGTLSPNSCIDSLETLKKLGCVATDEGKRLGMALKLRAINARSDLDDFATLGKLVEELPDEFTASELEVIREAFYEFIDDYAAECGISNPDELREEASRVSNVGDMLEVDTDDAEEKFKEIADEIESDQESHSDADDDRRGGVEPEVCSDGEIDSMFGTLEK